MGNNLVSTLVMPLSTLPPEARETSKEPPRSPKEPPRSSKEPLRSPSDVTVEDRRHSGSGRGAGHLITIMVQAPDDEDQEDEEDICRISVTQ